MDADDTYEDVAQRNQSWQTTRDTKVADAAALRAQVEVSEVTGIPRIDRHSAQLAASRSEVEVGTRLFVDAASRRKAKEELAGFMPDFVTGVPTINSRSAQLHREGNISDRLFLEAKERAQRAAARSPGGPSSPDHRQYASGLRSSSLGATTSPSAASPSADGSKAKSKARSSSVERPSSAANGVVRHTTDDLYRKGIELKKKREDELARLAREAREAAKPALNP
jgi:hypothetical protein